MNQVERRSDLIDTTDCLEAISVFKSAKNMLFAIALVCMLILQIVFWANRFGYIDKSNCPCELAVPSCASQSDAAVSPVALVAPVATVAPVASVVPVATVVPVVPVSPNVVESDKIESNCPLVSPVTKAAGIEPESGPEPGPEPTGPEPRWSLGKFDRYLPTCNCAGWVVRICNFLLIISATLYCLALLMSIKISLAGRLGGLAHISRAFFRSLFVLVLLMPWQVMMPGMLVGAMYTPKELLCVPVPSGEIVPMTMLYLRFCGLGLLVLLLLCMAQSCSAKWSRATLKRLGIR